MTKRWVANRSSVHFGPLSDHLGVRFSSPRSFFPPSHPLASSDVHFWLPPRILCKRSVSCRVQRLHLCGLHQSLQHIEDIWRPSLRRLPALPRPKLCASRAFVAMFSLFDNLDDDAPWATDLLGPSAFKPHPHVLVQFSAFLGLGLLFEGKELGP